MRSVAPCVLALCLLLVSQRGFSHDLGLVRIDLSPLPASRLAISVNAPPGSAPATLFAQGCQPVEMGEAARDTPLVNQRWILECAHAGEAVLRFDGIEEGAVVTSAGAAYTEGMFLDSVEGEVSVRPFDLVAGTGYSFAGYLQLGFKHILSGWDHLLFVLMLCLLASGWRLVKLVTAFTVGHSITLAMAVLGYVAVAGAAAEACIALSIVFLARQVLVPAGLAHGYAIVGAFGMLHGLGFAGALTEAGLPADRIIPALLAFNLGVEAGQLVFVALALVLFTLLVRPGLLQGTRATLAWLGGAMGCYWTLTRVVAG